MFSRRPSPRIFLRSCTPLSSCWFDLLGFDSTALSRFTAAPLKREKSEPRCVPSLISKLSPSHFLASGTSSYPAGGACHHLFEGAPGRSFQCAFPDSENSPPLPPERP